MSEKLSPLIEQMLEFETNSAQAKELKSALDALVEADAKYQELLLAAQTSMSQIFKQCTSTVKNDLDLMQEVVEWSKEYVGSDAEKVDQAFKDIAPRLPYLLKKYFIAVATGQLNRVVYRSFQCNSFLHHQYVLRKNDRGAIDSLLDELNLGE